MRISFVALCLCLLPIAGRGQVAPAQPSQNQTIYVDPVYGSSSGARGTTMPFPDLASALLVAQPYDHIIMRPGAYSSTNTATVNTANLTIEAYGAVMSANSQTVYPLLSIAAPDCHLEGLEINGNQTSANGTSNGAIEINAARVTILYSYIHDSTGGGVRLVTAWDGATIQNCTMQNCDPCIEDNLYGNSDISGLNVLYCTLINGRTRAIECVNNSSGAHAIYQERIVGNTILGNTQTGGLGIELYGGNLAGSTNIPHQNAIVTQNYVSGYATGISMNTCGYSEVSHNQVIAGSFCGIEFANSINCTGTENTILCPVVVNGYGGGGYGVSNNNGDAYQNIGLALRGGRIFADSDVFPINLYQVYGVTIDGVQIEAPTHTLYSHNSSNVTMKNVTSIIHSSQGGFIVPVDVEVSFSGQKDFHFTNNQFIYDNPSTGGNVIFNFRAGYANSVDSAELTDNYTNVTSCYYGFIATGSVAVNFSKQSGNYPASSSNAYGFVDLTGSSNATTLFPQANAPAAPTTPHAVTLYVDGNGSLHALHSTGKNDVLSVESARVIPPANTTN